MDIALLNTRIMIQKNKIAIDVIGNHTNTWTDYYSCYATISGESGKETAVVGLTVGESNLNFTIRYCKKVEEVTTVDYRILFNGEVYNILSMDHMNYKKMALKFKCQKVSR